MRLAALLGILVIAPSWAGDGGVRPGRTIADVELLYVHATWCPSCKRFDASKALEQGAALHPGLKIVDVDADRDAATLARYGVESIPALILVDASGFPLGRPRIELDDARASVAAISRLVLKMTKPPALPRTTDEPSPARPR